jgi:hypothetical protein
VSPNNTDSRREGIHPSVAGTGRDGGQTMKVKTFTGTRRFAVDSQVNDWLTESNVIVHETNVAFKALKEKGWDAVAGKTTRRRALAIAITVWYDEPYKQKPKPNPATWIFRSSR